jgi:hypothetical protein
MDFQVELDADHLKRMSRVHPQEGLKEILWNSCDADAMKIRITLETRQDSSGVEMLDYIKIQDDGHGLSLDNAKDALGKYGRSEKTLKEKTPSGRRYHGKRGEGRYKSFSIGESIRWTSVYNDGDTKKKIKIRFDTKTNIHISEPEITDENSGLMVEISLINSKASKSFLKSEEMRETILMSFAPYLMGHSKIKIIYDNVPIDTKAAIEDEKTEKVVYVDPKDDIQKATAEIRLIKWKKGKCKTNYICARNGAVLQEIPISGAQLPITMYLLSEYYEKLHKDNVLLLSNDDGAVIYFNDVAEKMLQEYKIGLQQANIIQEIDYLKQHAIYPFKEDATDVTEREQRKLFDIVAAKVIETVPRIKSAKDDIKRLAYNLIAEALKTNPSSLKKILEEVFCLSKEKQDEFAELLDQVSLSNIITTTKEVRDRLLFLDIIHDLVYTKRGTGVKERTQFHKMIEQNLWIFGDTYKFGTSDRSLKTVLLEHLKDLERKELQPIIPDGAMDDMDLIPDLCLWTTQRRTETLYENLVVELKRPNKVLGRKEFDQIKDYASAVSKNPSFDKTNYIWHFILIGKDFDSTLTNELMWHKADKVGNCKISIFRWSELITNNKLKYQFYKDHAKFDTTNEMVSKQIETVYGHLFSPNIDVGVEDKK